MSLNVNALATRVAAVGVTAGQAVTIINEAVALIGVVEQVYEGLSGDVKFKAVMAAMDQVIAQLGLSDKLTAIKKALGPVVNLVVAILNGASLWSTVFGSIASFAASLAKPATPPPLQASVGTTMSAGGQAASGS